MRQDDSPLGDALIELANLRVRDERLRRTSEAIAEALQALGETDDWNLGPALLLERLGAAMEVDDVALKFSGDGGEEILGSGSGALLRACLKNHELLVYLMRKPLRAVAEPSVLGAALGLDLALDGYGAMLSGHMEIGGAQCLLLCCGGKALLNSDSQDVFRRFQPIFTQSIRRMLDGRRASEMEMREREMAVAKEAAEAASRAKSEFVSRMSHELRTPLNAIIGFAQLLEAEQLNPSQRRYAQLISRSGDHLLGLINAVLEHAKIEAGHLELEETVFDLHENIASVHEIVAEQADAKGLRFDVHIPPDLPRHILGDPTRLRQVLINLLANAIKFTGQGAVELRAAVDTGSLCFSIRDSGIGMDEAALNRLFRPFSQADASIERQFGGTGLGLTIARELALAMGGDIEVESAPGFGTCFWLRIPLRLAAPAVPASSPPERLEVGAALGAVVGGRVLLVDDNRVNRQVAAAMLRRMGLDHDVSENGKVACERIAAYEYALVLMDMEMPVMDGLSATRAIRAAEARGEYGDRPRLPIVAMTANAMSEDRALCFAAGMDGYVAKPVIMSSLESELRRLLR